MPVSIAIGAGTAAVAGIGGGLIAANGAKDAAKTQVAGAERAADMQLGMFNTIRNDFQPYRDFGLTALPGLSRLLGLSAAGGTATGGAGAAPAAGGADWQAYLTANPDVANSDWLKGLNPTDLTGDGKVDDLDRAAFHYQNNGQAEGRALPTLASPGNIAGGATADYSDMQKYLESTPGYQFAKQQGSQAVENALAARGLGGVSGALGKGLARYVTGLADQTYGEQVNRLMGVAGIGTGAAAQTAAAGTTAAAGAAGSTASGANAAGAAQVAGANAAAAGLSTAANGLSDAYFTSRILGMYGK